jgi:glycosyltransferase involved in cell wall biosynthesis
MHPLRYISGDERRLPTLRDRRRNIRVLFAGNMDERKYASPFIQTLCHRFGYLTRYEAFAQLINANIDLEYIASFEHLKSVMAREDNQVVLVNSIRYDIPQSMWMDVLARADFFLAFPGVWMPMCHNVIEAMAVGTIPVLMHNNWFHPPLVDGRDCLRLQNGETLVDLLRDLAHLPVSTINCMKRNVIDYYERWLSPSSFIERVKSHPANELTLFFNYEERSEMEKVNPESVIISR